MDFLFEYIKRRWYIFVITVLTIIIIICCFLTFKEIKTTTNDSVLSLEASISNDNDTNSEELDFYKIDVKGAVKKPGVYELRKGSIIDDAIKEAGGLTSKAYSNNINLSKKISDEMVIYVYTKSEYQNLRIENSGIDTCQVINYDIDSCIQNGQSIIITDEIESTTISSDSALTSKSNSNTYSNASSNVQMEKDGKISINKATISELITLDGIGEAKAEKIIEYRTTNGGFKSIEEIKNVSGIGEAAYEKIKDNIKL